MSCRERPVRLPWQHFYSFHPAARPARRHRLGTLLLRRGRSAQQRPALRSAARWPTPPPSRHKPGSRTSPLPHAGRRSTACSGCLLFSSGNRRPLALVLRGGVAFPVPCGSGPWLGSPGGGHSSPSLLRQRIPPPPSGGRCFPFACVAATCSVPPSCGRLPPPAFTRSVFLHAVWSSCSTASTGGGHGF